MFFFYYIFNVLCCGLLDRMCKSRVVALFIKVVLLIQNKHTHIVYSNCLERYISNTENDIHVVGSRAIYDIGTEILFLQ